MGLDHPEDGYVRQVERVARGAGASSAGQGVGRLLGYETHAAVAWMHGPTPLAGKAEYEGRDLTAASAPMIVANVTQYSNLWTAVVVANAGSSPPLETP
jgi:hypothetical protein